MSKIQDDAESEPLIFNPFDRAFRVNPYPIYKRLLKEHPAYRTPFGVYVFSRYEDCISILRDHRRWSSDERKSSLYEVRRRGVQAMLGSDNEFSGDDDRPFLFFDPPDHTRLRKLVNQAFTPQAISNLRPRIQSIVNMLLDAVHAAGEIDVIADFGYPLSVSVICEMLGVPSEDQESFNGWCAELARSLDPDVALPPTLMRRRIRAAKESRDYFRSLVAERRKHLGSDILSALIVAEEEHDKLSERELLSTLSLLLMAGHETVVSLISNGVLQLLVHPDQMEKLKADPSLARNAVEEILRYDPPVQLDVRTALENNQIGGVTVPKGQLVVLLLGAANRDPARFANPDRFDITRDDDSHLGFGYGIHFCIGAPLARLEGEIALRTLTQRFYNLELRTNSPTYKRQITLRGLQSLRVRFQSA